jgi:hypothetical protein
MKRIAIAALLATGALLTSPSYAKLSHADYVGEAAAQGSGFRTIHVTPDTRAINVEWYETVNIDINGKVVTWRFNGVQEVISLPDIIEGAPNIKVYVEQTERFAN